MSKVSLQVLMTRFIFVVTLRTMGLGQSFYYLAVGANLRIGGLE